MTIYIIYGHHPLYFCSRQTVPVSLSTDLLRRVIADADRDTNDVDDDSCFSALDDVTLTVPPGQTVALVGATGAGKSTFAKLVARFYDPTGGKIRLDGVDLRDLPDEDLRSAVVMVTQENFLFSGTVADNIRFGRPGASDDEVVAAVASVTQAQT